MNENSATENYYNNSTNSYKSKKTSMKKTRRKLDDTKKIRLRTIFIWRYDNAKKIRTTSENSSMKKKTCMKKIRTPIENSATPEEN